MALRNVIDAVAVKAGNISGIVAAYGAGAAGSGAERMVRSIPNAPAALVLTDSGELTLSGPVQTVIHRLVIEVWVRAAEMEGAYEQSVDFVESFRTAWLTDTDLGGTCQVSYLTGYGPQEAVESDGGPYLVLPIRLTAVERFAVTATA